MPSRRKRRSALALAAACLVAAGCSNVPLWPFGGDGARERSRTPSDATEFLCEGGKRLYVRTQNQGASVWVILPEREFRLDRSASAEGGTYSNGQTTLVVNGAEAALSEGAAVLYGGCKSGAPSEGAGT